jgi:hypothetical protein
MCLSTLSNQEQIEAHKRTFASTQSYLNNISYTVVPDKRPVYPLLLTYGQRVKN